MRVEAQAWRGWTTLQPRSNISKGSPTQSLAGLCPKGRTPLDPIPGQAEPPDDVRMTNPLPTVGEFHIIFRGEMADALPWLEKTALDPASRARSCSNMLGKWRSRASDGQKAANRCGIVRRAPIQPRASRFERRQMMVGPGVEGRIPEHLNRAIEIGGEESELTSSGYSAVYRPIIDLRLEER